VVNITGAFALAWLAAWALRDAGRREPWRLLLGTGLCGGYTSYSGILLAVPNLLAPVQLLWLPSALATVVLGLVASAAGWWLGMRGAAARGAVPGAPVDDASEAAGADGSGADGSGADRADAEEPR
ncbi:MAG: hypothetical protein GXX90_04730, partial [Microbacteriaceae bacterium]|nr:hypothetical protein [Microbacteriaceae bacterium]